MRRLSRLALLAPFALAAACTNGDKVRADSLQAVQAEQLHLMEQLAAQKDSLTNVVLDADKFIATVDSQISTVKGLPKGKKPAKPLFTLKERSAYFSASASLPARRASAAMSQNPRTAASVV